MKTYPPNFSTQSILAALAWVSTKNCKNYAIISQAGILRILEKVYGLRICRATLNNHLRPIEEQGFLERTRRIKNGGSRGIQFGATMYELKSKAWGYLRGVKTALEYAGVQVFRVVNKALRPSPSEKCPINSSGLPARDEDFLPRIRDFIKSIS